MEKGKMRTSSCYNEFPKIVIFRHFILKEYVWEKTYTVFIEIQFNALDPKSI